MLVAEVLAAQLDAAPLVRFGLPELEPQHVGMPQDVPEPGLDQGLVGEAAVEILAGVGQELPGGARDLTIVWGGLIEEPGEEVEDGLLLGQGRLDLLAGLALGIGPVVGLL